MESKVNKSTTTDVVWDLSIFYKGIDDLQIDVELEDLVKRFVNFKHDHKGKLAHTLPQSLTDRGMIESIMSKITTYLYLLQSVDQEDENVRSKSASIESVISKHLAEDISFYEIELATLDEKVIEEYIVSSDVVSKHTSWIKNIRKNKPYYLSEEVESILTKTVEYTFPAWAKFYEEFESDLSFEYKGEKKGLSDMLSLLSTEDTQSDRCEVLKIINDGFAGVFAKYCARALHNTAGFSHMEQLERGYATPMTSRNIDNELSDASVDALHAAVMNIGPEYVKRFYKLKADVLGLEKMYWGDRLAKVDLGGGVNYSYEEAVDMIERALDSFSTAAGDHFRKMVSEKRIHAAIAPKKHSGAYCYGSIMPDGYPIQVILINYHGTDRDVSTLAHEEGHAFQFDESGKHNTNLTHNPPTAVSETGSIFSEMIIFDYQKNELQKRGDKRELLSLLIRNIDDVICTAIRQIGISNFERMVHGMSDDYTTWEAPKKLSVDEINSKWMKSIKEIYGEDGEVFDYRDAEHMWTYINHLHDPFYVYGYAVGQLFTHSLYAKKEEYGDRFVDMYTELLRKGNTESPAQLLAPFGLDLESQEFWSAGLENGLGKMLAEAEVLAKELGIE